MYDVNDILKAVKMSATEAVESTKPMNLVFGKVISAAPLKIQIEQKLILSKEQLMLFRNVTDYNLNVGVDIQTENTKIEVDNTHNHHVSLEDVSGNTEDTDIKQDLTHKHKIVGTKTIKVYNALKNGEKVALLRVQGGQKYVVLDRVVA